MRRSTNSYFVLWITSLCNSSYVSAYPHNSNIALTNFNQGVLRVKGLLCKYWSLNKCCSDNVILQLQNSEWHWIVVWGELQWLWDVDIRHCCTWFKFGKAESRVLLNESDEILVGCHHCIKGTNTRELFSECWSFSISKFHHWPWLRDYFYSGIQGTFF